MAHDRTLVQIRERSYLDVLDLALVVVRNRPVTIGLAALVGALPFAVGDALLIRASRMPAAVLLGLIVLQAPLATAPLTVVLGGLMFGERPRASQVLKSLARAVAPMILFQCVLRGFGLVTVFAYPLFPMRLTFLNEVILLERGRRMSALRRSMSLTEERGGELFGQWLAGLFLGSLFVLAFWAGTGTLVAALSSTDLTWEPSWRDLVGARFHLAAWLAIEFFAVARFFSYIDQRIRLEGWEVELRLRSVGKALEDAGRW